MMMMIMKTSKIKNDSMCGDLRIYVNVLEENGFVFVPMINNNLEYEKLVNDKYLVYRNRSENNRHFDVINMKNIIKYLASHL